MEIMGDLVFDVHLDCGHVNHDRLSNANKKPCWMVADAVPPIGVKGKCDTCKETCTVTKIDLKQGWGD